MSTPSFSPDGPQPGCLYLVPAPLDFGCQPAVTGAPVDVLPEATMAVAAQLEYWLCENAKTLRAGLKRIDQVQPLRHPLQTLHITELPRAIHKKGDHAGSPDQPPHKPSHHKQQPHAGPRDWLAPALQGHNMGLASEAGMPAIADPGSSVVRAAHQLGIRVVPLVGPVSLMLALSASGLNGQHFAFVGYLPQDSQQRTARIRELEKQSLQTGQSQIFIETPYRNQTMLNSLLSALGSNTWLSVSWGLTLDASSQAHTGSGTIADWKKNPRLRPDSADIMGLPAVYIMGC